MASGPPPSRSAMPSSFDEDPDFAQDNRMTKLKRLLLQDPFVPLGTVLTVAALIGATRAMRRNDHHTANKMFRRRIYAQAFTIVAIVIGSGYYNKDKETRKRDIEQEKERVRREKREKWLAELDFRDAEDRALKAERDERRRRRAEERGEVYLEAGKEGGGKVTEAVKGLMWDKDGKKNER